MGKNLCQIQKKIAVESEMKPWPNQKATKNDVRGVKNNNPGNIVISKTRWLGKRTLADNTDFRFEQFDTMENGARAHLKNLIFYIRNLKVNKLYNILAMWSSDNPPLYLKVVIEQMAIHGYTVASDTIVPVNREFLAALGYSMAFMENGRSPQITKEHYLRAYDTI